MNSALAPYVCDSQRPMTSTLTCSAPARRSVSAADCVLEPVVQVSSPGSRGESHPPAPTESGREPLGSSGSCRPDHQAERHHDQWANRAGHAMVTRRQDALALVKARNRSYFRRIQRNR